MSKEDGKETGSFKVSDRRLFTNEGELRPTAERSPAAEGGADADLREAQQQGVPESEVTPSGVDFSSLVLSLATTAMVHLGDIKDPSGEAIPPNLDAAKQMVNILDMLQKKTEGNRTFEESRLLDDVLYELRMKILSRSQAIRL